jgi:hypothetical protein
MYAQPAPVAVNSTGSAGWIVGLAFVFVIFLVFLIVFVNQTNLGPLRKGGFGGGKRSPAVATIGFHAAPGGTVATYDVTAVTTTPKDVTRNATIVSLVNCLLVTDVVAGDEVQRAKLIREGVYTVDINTVFSPAADALVTMYVNVILPSGSVAVESVPFAQVSCVGGQVYSLHATNQLQLPSGATINITMSTDNSSGGVSLTMVSWDVNVAEIKVLECRGSDTV